ncbi:DUF6779 domain-containing protein [Nocardia halotolerans]|uniref:DUF6779 domain-containing protein n=1 Tax=Nocardia halotolerans TaxID=1755878 RepID=A0ABV8VBX5_9NOCA
MVSPSRSTTPRRRRDDAGKLFIGALILLGLTASVLLVFSENVQYVRIGLVAALWAAVIGALAATRYRRDAAVDKAKARDLQTVYELQLEREINARREYEMGVEARVRAEVGAEGSEIAALRAELTLLRQNLQVLFDGALPDDQPALQADAVRVDALPSASTAEHSTEFDAFDEPDREFDDSPADAAAAWFGPWQQPPSALKPVFMQPVSANFADPYDDPVTAETAAVQLDEYAAAQNSTPTPKPAKPAKTPPPRLSAPGTRQFDTAGNPVVAADEPATTSSTTDGTPSPATAGATASAGSAPTDGAASAGAASSGATASAGSAPTDVTASAGAASSGATASTGAAPTDGAASAGAAGSAPAGAGATAPVGAASTGATTTFGSPAASAAPAADGAAATSGATPTNPASAAARGTASNGASTASVAQAASVVQAAPHAPATSDAPGTATSGTSALPDAPATPATNDAPAPADAADASATSGSATNNASPAHASADPESPQPTPEAARTAAPPATKPSTDKTPTVGTSTRRRRRAESEGAARLSVADIMANLKSESGTRS